jgi:transposase
LAQENSVIPISLRTSLMQVSQELEGIDRNLVEVDSQLREIAKQSVICQRLQRIPGVGLIVLTGFAGAVGDVSEFRSSRRFA